MADMKEQEEYIRKFRKFSKLLRDSEKSEQIENLRKWLLGNWKSEYLLEVIPWIHM